MELDSFCSVHILWFGKLVLCDLEWQLERHCFRGFSEQWLIDNGLFVAITLTIETNSAHSKIAEI